MTAPPPNLQKQHRREGNAFAPLSLAGGKALELPRACPRQHYMIGWRCTALSSVVSVSLFCFAVTSLRIFKRRELLLTAWHLL
jgi:hypothetical protein